MDETIEDLAEIKMLAGLIYDREQGEFKLIRKRRMDLIDQLRDIQRLADHARANAVLTDVPALLIYLDALAARMALLHQEEEALVAEENAQKAHLKTALARQIRLEDSEG